MELPHTSVEGIVVQRSLQVDMGIGCGCCTLVAVTLALPMEEPGMASSAEGIVETLSDA